MFGNSRSNSPDIRSPKIISVSASEKGTLVTQTPAKAEKEFKPIVPLYIKKKANVSFESNNFQEKSFIDHLTGDPIQQAFENRKERSKTPPQFERSRSPILEGYHSKIGGLDA